MRRKQRILLYSILSIFIIENAFILFPYVRAFIFQYETSRVERGLRLAEKMGCFSCHGPRGTGGMPNPGSKDGEVPSLDGGTIMMYVKNDEEIVEYIRDGLPKRKRQDEEYYGRYQQQAIKMPAYGSFLSEKEIDYLVSFIKASNSMPEVDREVEEGENLVLRWGCTNCHGPRGGGGMKNPGSFKGYIPGWGGNDFRELVEDERELYSWIKEGRIERFEKNPLASFFMRRQAIKMPAFKNFFTEEEIQAMGKYILWLNRSGVSR